jgi:transcriptional regulator with GAF, ATPase, and Fis domain
VVSCSAACKARSRLSVEDCASTEKQFHKQKEEIAQQRDSIEVQKNKIYRQKIKTDKLYQDIQVLSEIGKELTATLNLHELIISTSKSVNQLTKTDMFAIGIYNDEKKGLDFWGTEDEGASLHHGFDSITDNAVPSVFAFNNQQELVIKNYDEEYQQFFTEKRDVSVNKMECQSMVYLPLKTNKILGVMSIQNKIPYAPRNSKTKERTVRDYCLTLRPTL